ncbi:bacteriophage T4 gp5 trimerisation domain-containing protein, partial [Pseudomonas urmiensis]|uniref:bacteriophage T4 gp5 trimerisation domain-containing protein n=2 Tax=Pseudomonas TaxID=286 RepID=UPI0034DA341B
GFNELRFEDELGHEEVFIHAQRDQNNHVGNDETSCIGRNRVERVGNDEQTAVGNDLRQQTGRDHSHSIGRTCQVSIGQDLLEQVGNERRESTHANHYQTVGGDNELVVNGRQTVSVGQGVNHQTTVYQLQVNERIEFRSPGGSIILDQHGITLDGLTLTFKGPTQASTPGAGNSVIVELLADEGSRCEENA